MQLLGNFLKKKAVLTPLDHISHVYLDPFECTRSLTFESQLKQLILIISQLRHTKRFNIETLACKRQKLHNMMFLTFAGQSFNVESFCVPKGYQRGRQGKSHQNGDHLKQAMRKSCLPTGFEPAAFGLPVHCSTT